MNSQTKALKNSMNTSSDSLKQSYLLTLLDLARVGHAPDTAERLSGFIERYVDEIPAEDINLFSAIDLYGAILCHWRFANDRQGGQAKVRAYNPVFDDEGWQSGHTIIEVINDDMPFLVDSICLALNRLGLTLHLVLHPIITVQRNNNGRLLGLANDDSSASVESFIHIQIDRQTSTAALRAMEVDLQAVLDDVRAAIEDWPASAEILSTLVEQLEQDPPKHITAECVDEAKAFLKWLKDDHIALLGYHNYDLVSGRSGKQFKPAGQGLGILRESFSRDEQTGLRLNSTCLESELSKRELLLLTKANSRATVHRSAYLDFIAVRRFNKKGEIIGEHRFLGLYSSSVYSSNPHDIPILRRKIQDVLDHVTYPANSHKGKKLSHVLENYPRDELWEIDPVTLERIALGILHLQERQVVRLFIREDRFDRLVSCLVFVPRDNYNTEVRQKMQHILMQAFGGVSTEFNVSLTESVLARIHFIVRTGSGIPQDYDIGAIETQLLNAARRWKDHLNLQLLEHFGEEQGNLFFNQYADAFPMAYHEEFIARAAISDIEKIQSLRHENDIALSLYNHRSSLGARLHLKVFRMGEPIALSTSLDILENLGVKVLDEHPYRIEAIGQQVVWISDFGLQLEHDISNAAMRQNFQDAFALAFKGQFDNDGFNKLVLRAGLEWREVNILRAYWRYLKQVGAAFSQQYIEECLGNHPLIADKLVALFHARLAPIRGADSNELLLELQALLNEVPSLDDDRILSSFIALIMATTRTNYYQRDSQGEPKPWLSFKFDPSKIPGLPDPKPWAEIFVYSVRMEGVHLRGGPVARGGIRWSDRLEDFRTEVLGLMKAQTVKNAVIVPVGAKGGFICKRPPTSDRVSLHQEAQQCYSWFIRGLLDLTDNRHGDSIVPPDATLRHDGDDPYLVVAADKGTTHFSDVANRIAHEYEFWLDDAFASGGSQGYDHKKMGITARGAWESAKCHFRELDINIQTTPFTVIGIGDLSGDVFGNGMLQSEQIKLIAAFDHRHIFIDPNPDPAQSFAERKRLFELPTSSWEDYQRERISTGGGIYPRNAKRIKLSPEARESLGCKLESCSPNELIKEILKAPADLLYNGGIGTYVKASTQHHLDANDRGNDAVRINASDLRVKVVVEGGNLGFTQLARVEYALAGGRINTDAIDNSGGVDCSDHEVNLKILLSTLLANGDMTLKQRNQLMVEVQDDIAALVLRDNQQQTMAQQASAAIAPHLLHVHTRYLHALEKSGHLNRSLEFLPGDDELSRRKLVHQGLTHPEVAVLMAYTKMTVYPQILASNLPRELDALIWLAQYFPHSVVDKAGDALPSHYLKHEIIATAMTNDIVNRMGATFLFRLNDETGASIPAIVQTWMAACQIFDVKNYWDAIENLDFGVPSSIQVRLFLEVRRLLERTTRWILRNFPGAHEIDGVMQEYCQGVKVFCEHLPDLLPSSRHPEIARQEQEWFYAGVPQNLVRILARAEYLLAVLDIMQVDNNLQLDLATVANVYFNLGESLELDWLRHAINALPRDNRWQNLARISLRDDIYRQHRALVALVLQGAENPTDTSQCLARWFKQHEESVTKVRSFIGELKTQTSADLAMLSAALREIRNHLLTL